MIKTQFFPEKLYSKYLDKQEIKELADILNKVYKLYLENKIDILIVHKGIVTFDKDRIIFERIG